MAALAVFLRFLTTLASSWATEGYRRLVRVSRCRFTSGPARAGASSSPPSPPPIPPLVKRRLSCQYSSGPHSPLYLGPPTVLPRAPRPPRLHFPRHSFCSKGKQMEKKRGPRGKGEGGIKWNEIDGERDE